MTMRYVTIASRIVQLRSCVQHPANEDRLPSRVIFILEAAANQESPRHGVEQIQEPRQAVLHVALRAASLRLWQTGCQRALFVRKPFSCTIRFVNLIFSLITLIT